MSEIIRSVRGRCSGEMTIEKSRFLSYSQHVCCEAEARAFIAEIRSLHPTATHHCYGFIADKTGAMQRFSDDGEPQGTAGMPILDVIKNKGLFETAVVVTRYFGGIKLGAGGLVRAYSSACAKVLDCAEICLWQKASELLITVEYAGIDAALQFFSSHAAQIKESDYADKARYLVVVKQREEASFLSSLADVLSGKVSSEKRGEYFFPFAEV